MYLPAMPSMMTALDTDISSMHLTMSAYLAGFALFHLVCGPLADRYGRKPILTGGTVLFVLACIGCTFSTTVEELLLFRFIQGVGACVGPTLARAVARDVFGPTRAARALSLIAMLMAVAPAVAPTMGAILLQWLPWPMIFIFLAVYGVSMIVLVQVYLGESLPERQSLHPRTIAANYARLCRDAPYLAATFGSGLIYAGLMVYLSSSSFVYIQMLGVPVQYFGLIFLTGVAGYMLGSGISARLSSSFDEEQMVLLGAGLAMTATLAMLAGSRAFPQSIWALLLPMTLYSTGMGMTLPNAMASALRHFPHMAATASALLGFIQMGLSGSAAALVGTFLVDTPAPMVNFMVGMTALSLALASFLYRTNRQAGA